MNELITISAKDGKLVEFRDGKAWTTSLAISAEFGRAHKNVLQSIDSLVESGVIGRLDFKPTEYRDEQGKMRRMIVLAERGALIAMPFIGGRKSQEGQAKLVDAFLAMRAELTRQEIHKQNSDRVAMRAKGVVVRIGLTDVIQEFVEYATKQGSKSAGMYYMNITKMENKALFLIDKEFKTNFRDRLTAAQVGLLITAETLAQRALREGMAQDLHYKDIYKLAKDRVESFAGMMGKSIPGNDQLLISA